LNSPLPGLAQQVVRNDRSSERAVKGAEPLAFLSAVSMARAVNDEKLSREILKTAAAELNARLA